ncbi:MAG: GTP-binding protein, partial [Actinomycetota bacterium]
MTTGGRIPVTVIGGYLGSGKTTLVNHLLRGADERIAVLVNDFGSVNIDADLIESQDGETLRLANGCICCSLAEGFAAALDTVLELDPRPDRLVLEASGVADPAAVAAYGHGPGLLLDAVVVVVDGETVRAQAADGYLAQTIDGQLRAADVLVANKLDLVPEEERADHRSSGPGTRLRPGPE